MSSEPSAERTNDQKPGTKRVHRAPFCAWLWDGSTLIRVECIDELIGRMDAVCGELRRKAEELL